MVRLKLQYSAHLMQRANSLEKILMLGKIVGWKKMEWQRKRQLDGIIDSMDLSLSKLWVIVKDREAWHAIVQGVAKSQTITTEQLNSNIYCGNHFMMYVSQIIMLYMVNIYSAICQMYLNKIGIKIIKTYFNQTL